MAAQQAVLFDLDGVLADTAGLHFRAWRRLAQDLGFTLEAAGNERLKGVARMAALEIVLAQTDRSFSEAEKAELAARKNAYYREMIADLGPRDLLPGAWAALEACRRRGFRIALASASRNAPALLDRLGIAFFFDFVADAGAVRHAKPAPDIFLAAAEGLGVRPEHAIGIDDAVAGVAAIRAAGMVAIGVGDPALLAAADLVIPTIAAFDPARHLPAGPAPE